MQIKRDRLKVEKRDSGDDEVAEFLLEKQQNEDRMKRERTLKLKEEQNLA